MHLLKFIDLCPCSNMKNRERADELIGEYVIMMYGLTAREQNLEIISMIMLRMNRWWDAAELARRKQRRENRQLGKPLERQDGKPLEDLTRRECT